MTKRVPDHELTTEDGNPDDKRPRGHSNFNVVDNGDNHHHAQHMFHSSSSANTNTGGTVNAALHIHPDSSSSSMAINPTNRNSSFGSNGNFFSGRHSPATNGSSFASLHGLFVQNSRTISNYSKCPICLWPVGSARCYHPSTTHQLSQCNQ